MLEIFLLLLPLFGLIAVGYFAGVINIADTQWVKVLNLYGYYLAFPALIFFSIAHTTIHFAQHGPILLTQLVFGYGIMGITWLICRKLNFSVANRNTFTLGMYFANAAYLGIPALELVFGDVARGEGAIVVAVMIFVTFTLGVGILEQSQHNQLNIKRLLLGIIKNPLIWSAVLGVLVSIYHIPLPVVLDRFISLLAQSASPVVLVALGIFLRLNHPKRSTIKLATGLAVLKMVVIPGLLFIPFVLLPDRTWLNTSFIQVAMPLAITNFAFAEIYPLNKDLISTAIVISTLLAIVIVPLTMWLTTLPLFG